MRRGQVIITVERGIELADTRQPSEVDTLAFENSLQQAFASHYGAVEFPQLLMEVDAQVRFTSTLLRPCQLR